MTTHDIYWAHIKKKEAEQQNQDRIARIEKWAGLAMQGIVADNDTAGTYGHIAKYAFNYADAMEAEYQKRYINNQTEEN